MIRLSRVARVLLFAALCFLLPGILIAGGMQGRIKEKIGNSKNIQYNMGNFMDSSNEEFEPFKDTLAEEKSVKPNVIPSRQQQPMEAASPILSSYAVYKTDYKAEIEEDVVTVKGSILFEVFRKGWTQIPLVRSNVGLIDVSVNRGASYVNQQGGKYYLIVDKPGKYNLEIEFLIKAARERENGPGNFRFEILPAPISQFEFTIAENDVEIFVDPSIKIELTKEPKKTVAWAVMPNTDTIVVRWTKALAKETISPVKLEPKVYADTTTYASIGEGVIRCTTKLNYSILQSEIPNLRVALPEDVSVLEVKGNDLRDWKVSNKEGMQYLDVYFNFGVKGDYLLTVNYEKKINDGSGVVQIPEVIATGVEREKGYLGVAAATNVELAVNKVEKATLIDVKELPSSIWGSTANPILLAFKYISHPLNISIDVTRHEELPVLIAAIDSADYITLHTDEGKSLTKAIYQVRNNVKQFVHVALPKGATLWSVFVAGKPVKPAKDSSGDVLIPLEKSQLSGDNLAQFPVEIVYLTEKAAKMGFMGNLHLDLPKIDIPANTLNWSVYFPNDFAYFNFRGDVKQTSARRLGYRQSVLKEVGALSRMSSQNYVADGESMGGYGGQVKGVLPIKVDIPQEGRLYSFSKLLVTEKESPKLSASFITVFKPVHGFIRLLIWIAGIYLIVRIIRKRTRKSSL